MGNKTISVIIMLVLLCSGISVMLSTSSLGFGRDQPLGTRTKDNDNSFGTATELFNNSLIKGSLDTDDDLYDYFKINLRRVGRNGDELNTKLTITSVSGLIILALVNPEFYAIGDSYCLTGVVNPLERTFIACDAGYYYIILIGIFASPGTNINYDLEVNFSLIQRNIDTDNVNASANTATSGNTYLNSINPTWDYLDLYDITLTAGATATEGLAVELLNTDDKYLAVYNPDGSLREYSDIVFGDPDEKEIIKFAASVTGTYRIAVGISGEPVGFVPYQLTPTITSGIPHDDDFDEEHAIRVYNGTRLDMSFDSEFDVYDYYVMQLNSTDNLTVSILFKDYAEPDLNIEIYEPGEWPINWDIYWETDGMWTYGIAENDQTDYFIMVENYNTSIIFDYEIWFSLNGENVLFWDEPMGRNSTNLDFSMLEDSMDNTHVKLSQIFYDPDSPLTFSSPSHLTGTDTNISVEILANSTVKFTPDQDFYGYEIINFNATDITSEVLDWDVNVTVLPVNDKPVLEDIATQVWTQGEQVNLKLNITDVDNPEFTILDNSTLFNVDQVNRTIKFIPTNEQVGTYHINITVSDGELNDSKHFNAQIKNINDPPVFVRVGGKNPVPDGAIEFVVKEDKWNNFTVEVADIDHDIGVMDIFKFSVNTTDQAFKIDSKTGNISFFPLQQHVGVFKVTINVSDGTGGLAEQNLSFTVQNVNDPPEKPEIKLVNKSNLTINCSVDEVFDEDGDNLSYSWTFGDEGDSGTIVLGRNVNHTYAESGEYLVRVTVNDGNSGITMDSLVVNVTRPGTGPNGNDTDGNDTDGNDTKPFIDIDDDGLDDLWELANFGNLDQDATGDFDEDGFTNLQEFENKSNPTNKKDTPKIDGDGKDDDDDHQGFSLPSGPEMFMYITGIIAIINLILIIIIFSYFMMRKKRGKEAEGAEARAAWPEEDRFTVPCPECGQLVDENARECPYCGEEIDLSERAEDYREEEEWEEREGRGRRRGRGGPTGAYKARGARRERGRESKYEEEEAEWEPEDEEEEWEDEEYSDEDEPGAEEEEWDEEEYLDEEEPETEEEEWDEEEYYDEDEPEAEEEEWDEEEYYDEDEEAADEEWDEQNQYREERYDDRYPRNDRHYEEKRYYEDNYKPSSAWGRHEEKPAWDSGQGRRGYRR